MARQAGPEPISSQIEESFIHLEATLEIGAAHEIVRNDPKSWFVVEAIDDEDDPEDDRPHLAAVLGKELLKLLEARREDPEESTPRETPLASVLDSITPSYRLEISKAREATMPVWADGTPTMGQRTVIVDSGIPTGVVDAPERPGPNWATVDDPPRLATAPSDDRNQQTEGSPADRVPQHLLAETVSHLPVDGSAELLVTLDGAPTVGRLENLIEAVAMVDPKTKLRIIVRGLGAIALDGPGETTLPVQGIDESTTRRFAFRSLRSGVGILLITLFSGSTVVAEEELEILVGSDLDRDEPNVQRTKTVGQVGPKVGGRCTLMVDEASESKLLFHLVLPDDDWWEGDTQYGRNNTAPNFLRQFEALQGTRRPFEKHQEAEMKGLGSMLADFLPDSIKAPLWEQREQLSGIELLTKTAGWPWELCVLASGDGVLPDDRPFLAQRGLTRRQPRTKHPETIDVTGRRLLSAPDYTMLSARNLRAATGEAASLQQTNGFEEGPTSVAKVTTLLNNEEFSIFHFAGHSILDSDGLRLPRLVLEDSTFAEEHGQSQVHSGVTPTMLQRRQPDHQRQPLVFLNACTTGRLLEPGASGVSGFPGAFFKAGAGAFIGTQWEVEDGPAKSFAESFYTEFLDNGATFSEAVSIARSAGNNSGWSPSPLAYVAYGHPDAKAKIDD